MAFTQRERPTDKAVTDPHVTLGKTQEELSAQRYWTVLDDPSFRRLLRDGHHADATATLLSQLENEA
jgi:hypothetical protein